MIVVRAHTGRHGAPSEHTKWSTRQESEHDPSFLTTHFVWKNTTFRAPALPQNFPK